MGIIWVLGNTEELETRIVGKHVYIYISSQTTSRRDDFEGKLIKHIINQLM